MRTLSEVVAVVTGAASGIGRALALRLAREGCDLALADREAASLRNVAAEIRGLGRKVSTHGVDVADRVAMEEFRDAVIREHGRVGLVVNNAGVALYGTVAQVTIGEIEWLMNINFWGVVHGTKLFLPILQEQPEAHIVNLSSIFGIIAPPGQAAYCASKFAVRGFSEALRAELAGSTVHLSIVHPGGVRTNIAANARAAASVGNLDRSGFVTRFEKLARSTPEAAADRIVAGILANEPRILIGGDARILDRLQRLLPVRYGRVVARLFGGSFVGAGRRGAA